MNKNHATLITLPFQRNAYDENQPWYALVTRLCKDYTVIVAKDIQFPEISVMLPEQVAVLKSGEIRACDSTQRWDQGISYVLDHFPNIERLAHVAGDLSPDVDCRDLVSKLLACDAGMTVGDYKVPNDPPNLKHILGEYAKRVFLTLFQRLIRDYEEKHDVRITEIKQVRSEYFAYTREWLDERRKQWQLRWLPWTATMQNLVWSLAKEWTVDSVELGSVSDTIAEKGVPQRGSCIEASFQMDRIAFVAVHTFSWLHEDEEAFWPTWTHANEALVQLRKETTQLVERLT